MSYANEYVARTLKEARISKGLSQRALGQKVAIPQSHLSRIESGAVKPQLTSLIELARALDLELMLVPRRIVPVVEGMIRGETASQAEPASAARSKPAYSLEEGDDDA